MNKKMNAITMRILLTVVVCGCVFKVSYSHIVHVAIKYGNTPSDAMLFPICIDAMILVCALYLAAKVGVSKMTKFYAKLGRYFGFAATIFCNISASDFASSMAVAVNLIPAIALIITVELLIHGSQKTSATRTRK